MKKILFVFLAACAGSFSHPAGTFNLTLSNKSADCNEEDTTFTVFNSDGSDPDFQCGPNAKSLITNDYTRKFSDIIEIDDVALNAADTLDLSTRGTLLFSGDAVGLSAKPTSYPTWQANGGTLVVSDALSGNLTLTLTGATMIPAATSKATTNTAVGTFTLDGKWTLQHVDSGTCSGF